VTLHAHLVTDRLRFRLDEGALVERVRRAAAGLDVVQVRERDLDDRDLVRLVRGVLGAVAGTAARVLVNDRVDVAIAAGAHGVHLRGDSIPAVRVRAIAPAGFIVGRSVHTLQEIDAVASEGGCDYVMFGTVFASAGKAAGHPVAGLDGLREACRRSAVPVIAIGGIDASRLADIEKAGAAGFAAVGMFG
jgi:thiamine-phosphate diphosphorylase